MSKSKDNEVQVINCSNVLKGIIRTGTVELQYPSSPMRPNRERDYRGFYLRRDDSLVYLVHLISVLTQFGEQMELTSKLNLLQFVDKLANSIEGENSQTVKDAVASLYEKLGPKKAQSSDKLETTLV